MASISKHGAKWRAQIAKRGIRKSKVFRTKSEATAWAARQEHLIEEGEKPVADLAFADVLDRYARTVSPQKRGHRWEVIRLEAWKASDLGRKRLRDVTPDELAKWRDVRLLSVAPGTVRREMNLMGAVFSTAVNEWGLLPKNPLSSVRKPAQPPARDRLPTSGEIERMALVAGDDLSAATARAFQAFLFAIETAMRAGEIVALSLEDIDLDRRVAVLPMTKNGMARAVPLSSRAVEILKNLPDSDPVFGLTSRQIDVLFRKVRDKAGVIGLTFHDSRHAAITQLSKKLDVMDLARMVGHRDLRMLLTYYNESAADIAKRLD